MQSKDDLNNKLRKKNSKIIIFVLLASLRVFIIKIDAKAVTINKKKALKALHVNFD